MSIEQQNNLPQTPSLDTLAKKTGEIISDGNDFLTEGVIETEAFCERNPIAVDSFCKHEDIGLFSFDKTKKLLPDKNS